MEDTESGTSETILTDSLGGQADSSGLLNLGPLQALVVVGAGSGLDQHDDNMDWPQSSIDGHRDGRRDDGSSSSSNANVVGALDVAALAADYGRDGSGDASGSGATMAFAGDGEGHGPSDQPWGDLVLYTHSHIGDAGTSDTQQADSLSSDPAVDPTTNDIQALALDMLAGGAGR